MIFVKLLPFKMKYDNDDEQECALWQSEKNMCEEYGETNCDTSGFYYGTGSETEPKFCARHFYQHIDAAGYTITR
jgi:hypothetical protein